MKMSGLLKDNLKALHEKIALEKKTHPELRDPVIVAVSKKQPLAKIRQLHSLGIQNFAENYLQEAVEKIHTLGDLDIHWHFIGALQSKKIKDVVENFEWIHTVCREGEVDKISKVAAQNSKIQKYLIQVNIGEEPTKQGVSPSKILEFMEKVQSLRATQLRGLMIFPPLCESQEESLSWFEQSKDLFLECRNQAGPEFDCLSMGTSSDYPLAYRCGATHLRVGQSLLGART